MQNLEIKNLSFSYRKKKIFENINLNLEKGDVVGLIGPNGIGKSTLLKIIANVVPSSFKCDKKINFLIDKPFFYPNLSGYENLKVLSYPIKDKCDIALALEKVNLKHDKTKYKNYSLGMKQKLGISKCILSDADIYLFDEPLNGLDPKGIIMFRNIIKDLQSKGKIIIISSHLLRELDGMVNKAIYIKDKKVKMISSLVNNENYTFKVSQVPSKYQSENKFSFKIQTKKENINNIVLDLISENVQIYEIKKEENLLEDFYLKELS